jgi:hypothetical protein
MRRDTSTPSKTRRERKLGLLWLVPLAALPIYLLVVLDFADGVWVFWALVLAGGFAIGFLLKRRWVAIAPIAIAIGLIPFLTDPCDSSQYDCDTAGLAALIVLVVGLIAATSLLAGAIAARATSARRRSS